MPQLFHEIPETSQILRIKTVPISPLDHQTYILKPPLEVYRSAVCFAVAIITKRVLRRIPLKVQAISAKIIY